MTKTLTTETIKLWRINAEITLGETDELDPENNAAKAILALTAELLRYREAAENPSCWEIAGQLFTTKEDALKPGYVGTPEPLYDGPVLTDDREAQPVGFDALADAVKEVTGGIRMEFNPDTYKGHQSVPFMNFTSLSRIVEMFRTAPPAPAVPDFGALTKLIVGRLIDCGAAGDDSIADAETFVYNACRAAMLAQPVSQGKLNSPEIPDGCQWTYDERDYKWDSACGEAWMFSDGGPTENGVKFCQGCGKPVLLAAAPEGGNG